MTSTTDMWNELGMIPAIVSVIALYGVVITVVALAIKKHEREKKKSDQGTDRDSIHGARRIRPRHLQSGFKRSTRNKKGL